MISPRKRSFDEMVHAATSGISRVFGNIPTATEAVVGGNRANVTRPRTETCAGAKHVKKICEGFCDFIGRLAAGKKLERRLRRLGIDSTRNCAPVWHSPE